MFNRKDIQTMYSCFPQIHFFGSLDLSFGMTLLNMFFTVNFFFNYCHADVEKIILELVTTIYKFFKVAKHERRNKHHKTQYF